MENDQEQDHAGLFEMDLFTEKSFENGELTFSFIKVPGGWITRVSKFNTPLAQDAIFVPYKN